MDAPQEKLVKPRHGLISFSPWRGVARCSCRVVFSQGTAGLSIRAVTDLLLDLYNLHLKAMVKP